MQSQLRGAQRRLLPASLLLGAALLLAAACAEPERTVSQEDLLRQLASAQPPLVLDVRTVEEYEGGHVPGAVNVPHGELAGRLGELGVTQDAPVVVYCERGRRAGMAEEVLRGAGYQHVLQLEGNMSAWREAGRPVESD